MERKTFSKQSLIYCLLEVVHRDDNEAWWKKPCAVPDHIFPRWSSRASVMAQHNPAEFTSSHPALDATIWGDYCTFGPRLAFLCTAHTVWDSHTSSTQQYSKGLFNTQKLHLTFSTVFDSLCLTQATETTKPALYISQRRLQFRFS